MFTEGHLDELVAAVATALSALPIAQASGRVRELPDRRTLRYYTAQGLLTAPLRIEQRKAVYGLLHLWQILAIKALQAQGEGLDQVRARLEGADLKALRLLCGLKPTDPDPGFP